MKITIMAMFLNGCSALLNPAVIVVHAGVAAMQVVAFKHEYTKTKEKLEKELNAKGTHQGASSSPVLQEGRIVVRNGQQIPVSRSNRGLRGRNVSK